MARAGYRGYIWGQTFIVPGLLNMFNSVALRVMPHFITVPLVGWLLKRR